ncbi:MAG TPA: hypothetical protein VHB69_11170 [Mycobacteriales bacterium]|nr:hypothetical protein [Mycobacteriales bacterium]
MLLAQSAARGHGQAPGVPSSTVRVTGPTQVRYCVSSYAPSHDVTVTGPRAAIATIHTNYLGTGCTEISYDAVCGGGDQAVATGIGADGNPATSAATLTAPAGTPTCAHTGAGHASGAGAGGGLSGTEVGVLVVVIAVVAAGAAALALAVRRRRSAAADQGTD